VKAGLTVRVAKNSVLRRLLGLEREKATEGWTKLPNVGLHDLMTSL
jgi:hypothetical protein